MPLLILKFLMGENFPEDGSIVFTAKWNDQTAQVGPIRSTNLVIVERDVAFEANREHIAALTKETFMLISFTCLKTNLTGSYRVALNLYNLLFQKTIVFGQCDDDDGLLPPMLNLSFHIDKALPRSNAKPRRLVASNAMPSMHKETNPKSNNESVLQSDDDTVSLPSSTKGNKVGSTKNEDEMIESAEEEENDDSSDSPESLKSLLNCDSIGEYEDLIETVKEEVHKEVRVAEKALVNSSQLAIQSLGSSAESSSGMTSDDDDDSTHTSLRTHCPASSDDESSSGVSGDDDASVQTPLRISTHAESESSLRYNRSSILVMDLVDDETSSPYETACESDYCSSSPPKKRRRGSSNSD